MKNVYQYFLFILLRNLSQEFFCKCEYKIIFLPYYPEGPEVVDISGW